MSTIKISELPKIYTLNQNTDMTIVLGVDVDSGVTSRITATTLGSGLYAHRQLNVGNNDIILPNIAAQFAGTSDNYLQVNLQNNSGNGSADYVITANNGTDSTYYIDMGYNGSNYNYDGYTYAKPLDGYLIVQGLDNESPGGNLVIGTTTPGKDVSVLVGSIDESEIMSKFVANTGFKMVRYPITFADNTSQNTAAAPFVYSNSSYDKANSAGIAANTSFLKANSAFGAANSAGVFANSALDQVATALGNASTAESKAVTAGSYANSAFLQANTPHAIANSAAVYANGAFIQANAVFTQANNTVGVDATQNTNIGLAWTKANNALANTSGTFDGNLTLTGNLIATGIQSTTGAITTGNLIVDGTTSISGTANLAGQLNVVGAVSMNATLVLANSNFTATESAVTISASPTVAAPANDGYMIHISGKNGIPARIVTDSYGTGSYALYAARTARGNVDYPAAVQTGDIIGRFSSGGYGTTKFQPLGTGRIDFVASENYTDAATGSQIKFWNCPVGSNTLTNILTLNGDSADFTGVVSPQKGFIYTPRVPAGDQTAITIDYATDSMIRANCAADLTVSHSNFTAGKIVEMWLTNNDNSNHSVTHGCAALRSTNKSTSATITAGSSMYLKFFSVDGDLANTFVSING